MQLSGEGTCLCIQWLIVRQINVIFSSGPRSDEELSEMQVIVSGGLGMCMPNGIGYVHLFCNHILSSPSCLCFVRNIF